MRLFSVTIVDEAGRDVGEYFDCLSFGDAVRVAARLHNENPTFPITQNDDLDDVRSAGYSIIITQI